MATNCRGRVVICDDEADVRTSVSGIIEKNGFTAHAFENGLDTLSYLLVHHAEVDILLTDLRMPEMGGLELLEKTLTINAEIPVILMTAFADINATVSAVKHGAFDFIIKPYDPEYLLQSLDKGVTYRRLRLSEKMHRIELEQALAERTDELNKAHEIVLRNEKMALVGQMAAGIAHEINNPVGFISSNLESLQRYSERLLGFLGMLTESLDRYCPAEEVERIGELRKKSRLDKIVDDIPALLDESLEGVERIKEIVRNLKGFSRADDNVFVPADINEVIAKALNIVNNELKYVATVVTDYGETPPVQCLPNQLTQVFINILINAAHAMEEQGEITVKSGQEGENVLISISDTGRGIPEHQLSRIFEPFFTTKEAGKGTGLGLSISNEIIRNHGGEISVTSKPGKGTTFTVSLPGQRA